MSSEHHTAVERMRASGGMWHEGSIAPTLAELAADRLAMARRPVVQRQGVDRQRAALRGLPRRVAWECLADWQIGSDVQYGALRSRAAVYVRLLARAGCIWGPLSDLACQALSGDGWMGGVR